MNTQNSETVACFTVPEAANLLAVSRATVHRLTRAERIKSFKRGRRTMIPADEISRVAAAMSNGTFLGSGNQRLRARKKKTGGDVVDHPSSPKPLVKTLPGVKVRVPVNLHMEAGLIATATDIANKAGASFNELLEAAVQAYIADLTS